MIPVKILALQVIPNACNALCDGLVGHSLIHIIGCICSTTEAESTKTTE